MYPPKVSVLIPTYNYAHILDETIQCVLNQTYQDFELIVVDDNSTDNTIQVVEKYLKDERVKFFRNEKNLGTAGNWNKCLEHAKGEYIKYLCADDLLHPEILERYVPIMDQNQNVSLITCHKQEFGSSERELTIPFSGIVKGTDMIYQTLKHYNWIGEPTLAMFRKRDVDKIGVFEDYLWIVDWEMWVRLLSVGDCYIVNETLAFIRRHEQQVTKKVFRNFISRKEEYYFFKSIQQGKYNIDFAGRKKQIPSFVKRKAIRCAKDMYLILPKVGTKKYRRSFVSLFKIAAKEHVLLEPLVQKIKNSPAAQD